MLGELIIPLMHAEVHHNTNEDDYDSSSNRYASNVEGLAPVGLQVAVDQTRVVLAGVHVHIAGQVKIGKMESFHC